MNDSFFFFFLKMNEMEALFHARKKNVKKKGLNFNNILDDLYINQDNNEESKLKSDNIDNLHEEVESPYDNLKDSSGAAKIDNLESKIMESKNTERKQSNKSTYFNSLSSELISGDWSNNHEESLPKASSLFNSNSSTKLASISNIASSSEEVNKIVEKVENEETNRKLFHLKRQQALKESSKSNVVDEKKKGNQKFAAYCPKEYFDKKVSLKTLDSHEMFPSLDGEKIVKFSEPTTSSVNAWNIIREDLISDTQNIDNNHKKNSILFEESVERKNLPVFAKYSQNSINGIMEHDDNHKPNHDDQLNNTSNNLFTDIDPSFDKEESKKIETNSVKQTNDRFLSINHCPENSTDQINHTSRFDRMKLKKKKKNKA